MSTLIRKYVSLFMVFVLLFASIPGISNADVEKPEEMKASDTLEDQEVMGEKEEPDDILIESISEKEEPSEDLGEEAEEKKEEIKEENKEENKEEEKEKESQKEVKEETKENEETKNNEKNDENKKESSGEKLEKETEIETKTELEEGISDKEKEESEKSLVDLVSDKIEKYIPFISGRAIRTTEKYLNIVKVGEKHNELQGSKFDLIKINKDKDGTETEGNVINIDMTNTSRYRVEDNDLTRGKYKLVETTAPEGYRVAEPRIIYIGEEFEVPEEGGRNIRSRIDIENVVFKTNKKNETTIYPNNGEYINCDFNIKISDELNSGDYFDMFLMKYKGKDKNNNILMDGLIEQKEILIFGAYGVIAKGKAEDKGDEYKIRFEFTNYVDFAKENNLPIEDYLKGSFKIFVNPAEVRTNQDITFYLYYKEEISKTFTVNYDGYIYYGSVGLSNKVGIGNKVIRINNDNTFEALIYYDDNFNKNGFVNFEFSKDIYSYEMYLFNNDNSTDMFSPSYSDDFQNSTVYGRNITQKDSRNLQLNNFFNVYTGYQKAVLRVKGSFEENEDLFFKVVATNGWNTKNINYRFNMYVPRLNNSGGSYIEFGNQRSGINFIKVGEKMGEYGDMEKHPLADVEFILKKEEVLEDDNSEFKTLREDIKADERGRFTLYNLEDGKYQLWEKEAPKGYFTPMIASAEFEMRDGRAIRLIKKKKEEPIEKVRKRGTAEAEYIVEEKDITDDITEIVNSVSTKVNLYLNKRDDQGKFLKGAKFELRGLRNGYLDIKESDDHDLTEDEDRSKYNGKPESNLIFRNLPYDEYILREIKAPEGYILDSKEKHFKIGGNFDTPKEVNENITNYVKIENSKITVNTERKPNEGLKDTIYPNREESFNFETEYHIDFGDKDKLIEPGDYFDVRFSDNINPGGFVPAYVLNERKYLKIVDKAGVVAIGEYYPENRKIRYIFTDYVNDMRFEKLYVNQTMQVDKINVPYYYNGDSKQTFSQWIDNDKDDEDRGVNDKFEISLDVNYDVGNLENKKYYYSVETKTNKILTIGSFITETDKIEETYKGSVYVNIEGNKIPQSKLLLNSYNGDIVGTNDIKVDEINVYKITNPNFKIFKPSYPNEDPDITNPNIEKVKPKIEFLKDDKDTIAIDLGKTMANGNVGYIVRVKGKYRDEKTNKNIFINSRLENIVSEDRDPEFVYCVTHSTFIEGADSTDLGTFVECGLSNIPNKVWFKKVDSQKINHGLEGAEFYLEKDGKEGPALDYKGEELISKTDSNGDIYFKGLLEGDYKVYEKTPPVGYIKNEGVITSFSVGRDGKIKNPDLGKVKNIKNSLDLPETGVEHIIPYIGCGVVVIIIATIGLISRRRA